MFTITTSSPIAQRRDTIYAQTEHGQIWHADKFRARFYEVATYPSTFSDTGGAVDLTREDVPRKGTPKHVFGTLPYSRNVQPNRYDHRLPGKR